MHPKYLGLDLLTIHLTVFKNSMVAFFDILTHLRYFWTEKIGFSLKIRQKLPLDFLL